MKILATYKNGNHKVIIFDDGTKIKETIDPNADHFTYDFPENFDIKITDYCDAGCKYCHENSTVNGKHGNLRALEPMIKSLQAGTECACLSGKTIVHTPNGSKHIEDLSIGDEIYNSANKISKIKNITKTNKKMFKLKLKRGFSVLCSDDHPFMVNNQEIQAKNLYNKIIDSVSETNGDNSIVTIDMAKYIHKANPNLVSSRGGKIFENDEIRLTNSSAHSKRYIKFDETMAYLYGWYVAEGSRSSLSLNINEQNYAKNLSEIWENHTGLTTSIFLNENGHSLQLELKNRTFTQHLFKDEFKVGHGARNKNLSYLYNITNKEIIRNALFGLIMGDGCFRTRTYKHSKNDFHVVELKTSSEYLAYDFVYLLKRWFNIQASIVHNKHTSTRPINGRNLPLTDYYAVTIYKQEDLAKLFPNIYHYKNNNNVDTSRKLIVEEIIDTNTYEDLYDITLDGDIHTFPVNGCLITHNCGGGNALAHPDLLWFLEALKNQGVIANITINQRHLFQYKDLICKLVAENLVHGIGVSLTDSSNMEDKEFIKSLGNNVVIHTIAGILSEKDLSFIEGMKVLVLGYKDLRRGHAMLEKQGDEIHKNIEWLKTKLPELRNSCKVISFDCLGIEQLNPKGLFNMSNDEYYSLFQGADTDVFDSEGNITCATMYIDVENMEVARCSTQVFEERESFTGDENIRSLFKKSCKYANPKCFTL